MRRFETTLSVMIVMMAVASGCATAPGSDPKSRHVEAGAAPSESPDADGTPDLSRGIDKARLQDSAYQEELSEVTKNLSTVSSEISAGLTGDPDLVSIGVMPGVRTLVLYWSGAADAPRLSRAVSLAMQKNVPVIVAPRKASKNDLEQAQLVVERNMHFYNEHEIYLSSYGGFAADFDGLKVTVNKVKSRNENVAAIQKEIGDDVRIPVQVSLGTAVNF